MANPITRFMNDRRKRAEYELMSRLDDHLLADIGITRDEVDRLRGGALPRFPARFGGLV